MIDENTKEAKWELARSLLCREVPYLAAAVWALRGPFWRKGIGTAGVSADCKIYLDPELVMELPRQALASLIEHEVWHLLLTHAARMQLREKEQWNVAGDLEIHAGHMRGNAFNALLNANMKGCLAADFGLEDGKTADYYYDNIEVVKVQLSHDSGSAADGLGRDYEGKRDGDPDVDGASAAEQRGLARAVAQHVKEHAKHRGDVPDGAQRWAEEVLGPPVVDWRVLYRMALQAALGRRTGAVDYTYSKPSRRDAGASRGYIAPGLYRPVPEVAVILDTSGSMSERELGLAMREVTGAARAVGARVRVASCDADVYEWRHYAAGMELSGGGGTDMRVGIASAIQLRPRPHVVVVMTDGETLWPDERPRKVGVIAVLTSGSSVNEVPPWIATIVLPEASAEEEE